MILSLLLSFIFLVLGLFHFYWLFGGEWGLKSASPVIEGKEDMKPPRWATLIVALGLTALALFYAIQSGLISILLPKRATTYVGWFIPAIFMLRAVGEFKYVGFFKKNTDTDFGKMDTILFSPLCLAISIVGTLIQFGY